MNTLISLGTLKKEKGERMTRYYSDAIRQERYKNARKTLDELRGQLLTAEQMGDIFGSYDQGGSMGGVQEDRDAFMQIVSEGWLLEQSSGQYRVAGHTRQETIKVNSSDKGQIRAFIQACAEDIQTVVLSKVKTVEARFPSAKFVRYPDYPNTNKKKNTVRPALVLFTDNRGTYRLAVVLTPEGIFEYRYGMAMDYICLESDNATTSPLLWIQYAEQALNELNRF